MDAGPSLYFNVDRLTIFFSKRLSRSQAFPIMEARMEPNHQHKDFQSSALLAKLVAQAYVKAGMA
jgi:hypothetical protein